MEDKEAECILCGKKVRSEKEDETICNDCLEVMIIEQNYKEAYLNPHLTFF